MKTSLTERDGWFDYIVEHEGRRLYGTCSDRWTAQESIRQARETILYRPINPRRNP